MARNTIEIQLHELKDEIVKLNQTIATLQKTLRDKDVSLAKLTEENAYLRRKLFGTSSEKRQQIDPDQISFLEQIEDIPVVEVEEIKHTVVKEHVRSRKAKPTMQEQFRGAKVEQVVVDSLTDEQKICPVCGTQMVPIGTEVLRRELEFIPAQYIVKEYIATTYSCPVCKETEDPQFIKDEGRPPALFENSYATPSLVASILKNKFVLSLPFYRQEQDLRRSDICISRASMASWAILVYQYFLQYMVQYFLQGLRKRHFLMMDETPIQVLREPEKRPQSKSYLWVLRSGEDGLPPLVLYQYAQSRSGDHAKKMLEGSPPGLYLMVDGFQGYDKLKDVKRCACYAHIRRYFLDAVPKGSEYDLSNPAVEGVHYCDRLFRLEHEYKEEGISYEERQKRRLREEEPIVDGFIQWLGKQEFSATSNKFNRALLYARNRRDMLKTYLEDGRCSLSNNWSENSIRPVVVGRKNWLFSDTVEGAEASAGIYTIVEMAKLYKLDPYKYLKYLLEQKPTHESTEAELEKLAPWSAETQEVCK